MRKIPIYKPSVVNNSQEYNMTSVKYLSLILALTLAACGVPEMVKPGTSQQEAAKDRFECLRASESTSSWSVFGLGSSQVRNNPDVYRSCMEARGYVMGAGSSSSRSSTN